MTIALVTAFLCAAMLLGPQCSTAMPAERYQSSSAGPMLYIPPRAYLLCWKGVCDPRLWAEMGKRTPLYNFGLGKRSQSDPHYHYGDSSDDDLYETWDANGDSAVEEADEDETTGERDQATENAPLNIAKRSKYSFGVGKKDDYHRRFDFGLGKRASGDHRFAFGLGKRQSHRFNFGLGKREADPGLQEQIRLEHEGLREDTNVGDIYPSYGQSGMDDVDDDDIGLSDKRSRMYEFGLGKRDKMYSFGLGKREKMYNFGLGKRTLKYGFGLGKRASARSDRIYGFGLGKRAAYGPVSEYRATDQSPDVEEVKRAGPYSFGLGKRSVRQPLDSDRLRSDGDAEGSRPAFGLEKAGGETPSTAAGGDDDKTTAAPALDQHQQQQQQQQH